MLNIGMKSVLNFASLVSEMIRSVSHGSLAGGTNMDCESQGSPTPIILPRGLGSCFPRLLGEAGDGEWK